MVTPSQFAWACCRAGDFPPPEVKRGPRFGADPVCCLCGGETAGAGWHRKDAIGPTFTDFARLARPASMTACQSCVATSKSEGWIQYVAAHPERGLSSHFPQKGDTPPRAWNWLYSHHLFVWPDRHECPDRARWRAILADPPAAPFLAILAVSGKKQLIFKSRVALNGQRFPLQFDDDTIMIAPDRFRSALADFDRLCQLGFSKDSILSGEYHNKTLLDVGLSRWREAEAPAAEWRKRDPHLWAVCHYVAQRPEGWEPPARVDYSPAKDVSENMTRKEKAPLDRGQIGLF